MVGQRAATMKPSRSDDVPDPVQQLEITNRVRTEFESLAPKRPAKPNRSEPDPVASSGPSDVNIDKIPELDKLRSLQSQIHVRFLGDGDYDAVQDEFVETQYYTELVSIDKQHHTTGSGFIRVMKESGEEINGYGGDRSVSSTALGDRAVFRSNPATNDWVPAIDEQVFLSSKPNRSESF